MSLAYRTYRGFAVIECERAKGEHSGKWTVQTYHKTGMPYADELCPHYQTLKSAHEAIDREIVYRDEFSK